MKGPAAVVQSLPDKVLEAEPIVRGMPGTQSLLSFAARRRLGSRDHKGKALDGHRHWDDGQGSPPSLHG